VPWPVSSQCHIINPQNIEFHPDNIDNFNTFEGRFFSRIFDFIFNYYRNKIGGILRIPQFVFKYKDAMRYLLDKSCEDENKVPVIVPNWDWSPRRGAGVLIFTDSTPSLFKQHVKQALELIKRKPKNKQILILKSWNEWGEGNYMEPDLKFGKGYIQALKEALEEADK